MDQIRTDLAKKIGPGKNTVAAAKREGGRVGPRE